MIEIIKKVISEVKEDPELLSSLTPETDLINDIGLDSLQMIDFMLQIESELDIVIDFDRVRLGDFHSIQAFALFLSTQNKVGSN